MAWLRPFGLSLLLFLVLDYVWLGFVMIRFNTDQLRQIGRIVDGRFEVLLAPAALAYFFMAVLMTFFVWPLIASESLAFAFLKGALLGLDVYGIYDMTNLAILKDYPVAFAAVDMAWGTFLFGTVAAALRATA